MKNLKNHIDDSLRQEYRRSDFGELVKGKHALTQVQFAELVKLLLACVGEDENLTFSRHSVGNYSAKHQQGDWTYEIDNSNQITLRYWLGEFENIDEGISNPPCIMTAQQRTELKNLLVKHVQELKARVEKLR